MTVYYLDFSASSNGAGTIADPKNTWVGLAPSTGNAYFGKRGTSFTTAVGSGGRVAVGSNGTAATPILIGCYGDANAEAPKLINRADTGFNLDRRSYVLLENWQIDNTLATTAAIGGGGDSGAEAVGNEVRFCEIYGGTVEGMSWVTNLDRQTVSGLRVHHNHIHDVGGHGMIFAGLHVMSRAYKNTVERVGTSSGKHGISAHPHRTTSTPSWSNVSGNVYKTTIGAQTNITTVVDIYGVRYVNGNITLTRAVSDSAPANGEYGFTGGELYINIGGVPAGQVVFSYSAMTAAFDDNVVSDVTDFDGQEGHGIDLDDLTAGSYIRRNTVSLCEGRGIQVNMGRGNTVSANLVYNCTKDGIRLDVNAAVLNVAYGNTVISGATTAAAQAGIVLGANNTAKNNVVVGYATGITGGASSTENYNCLFTAAVRSGGISAGANDTTADPLLTSDYRPKPTSPLLGAGTHLGYTRDIDRKQRPNPPSIGAFDVATLRDI